MQALAIRLFRVSFDMGFRNTLIVLAAAFFVFMAYTWVLTLSVNLWNEILLR